MDACSPLREYAWLVDAVRRHQAELNNLEAAVDAAIDEMPDDFMIKTFLIGNRAEVKSMFERIQFEPIVCDPLPLF